MHQIRFWLGFAPDPVGRGGAYSAPPDSLVGFKGPTSKGREGRGRKGGREGKEGIRKKERGGRDKGEGRGGKGGRDGRESLGDNEAERKWGREKGRGRKI